MRVAGSKLVITVAALAVALVGSAASARQPGSVKTGSTLPRIDYIKDKVWVGQTLFGPHDDWVPYVAADPSAPYVYIMLYR